MLRNIVYSFFLFIVFGSFQLRANEDRPRVRISEVLLDDVQGLPDYISLVNIGESSVELSTLQIRLDFETAFPVTSQGLVLAVGDSVLISTDPTTLSSATGKSALRVTLSENHPDWLNRPDQHQEIRWTSIQILDSKGVLIDQVYWDATSELHHKALGAGYSLRFDTDAQVPKRFYLNFWQPHKVDRTSAFYQAPLVNATLDASPVEFRTYPNPVLDQVTIELPAATTQVSLLDLNGRPIYQVPAPGPEIRWDLRHLPNGTYYVVRDSEADREVFSIVKK